MNVIQMTRKEFEALPYRKWDEEIICDGLIILPGIIHQKDILWHNFRKFLSKLIPSIFKSPEIYEINGMHDSGFRTMDFVAYSKNEPICLLSGCSDVIHIDGIGGFGHNWLEKYGRCPKFIPPSGWNMDCLPKSGLLRLWCNNKILCASALSSFEIYAIDK